MGIRKGPRAGVPGPSSHGERHQYNGHADSRADSQPGGALSWLPCTWDHPQDRRSQIERRRRAAARSVPLDCGCTDPLVCRCTEPPLTERALDAWRDAAWHVIDSGQMPLVPLDVRRALWRRGGRDRQLAELLHQGCGEVAS